ncbi:hypothetical protein SAMD00024442_6_62 [Candidatus Symbiothrix dinenymphae]|nr:hypothetical protein SAMD00024442_6_62 [Candidatus Symbiothrix dinenymphae]
MSVIQENIASQARSYTVVNYLPAVFKKNKSGWLIEYYAENPLSKKLQRKQIKLNRLADRYHTQKEAIAHINRMIADINVQLSTGWNPFFEGDDARLYTPIGDAIKKFIEEKTKESRRATIVSYVSFTSILMTWVEKTNPNIYASTFSDAMAAKFMDYVYNERKVSARSYNNEVKFFRSLFNWLIEKFYAKHNPFNRIKLKKKQEKTRILIPKETRAQIITCLRQQNSNFLLVCKLMYTSLIRPKEILNIQLKHIHIQEKYICIPANIAKNGKERHSAMNQAVIDDLTAMHLEKYNPEYYLFGPSLTPDKRHCTDSRFRKEWDKIRDTLKLPKEMQLYSFRDTGINEMLKSGIDDLSVMQHADHHDLSMTTMYANHHDPNLSNIIYERAPEF